MNTKILMSLVMIGVASAGVGYGTFAFFNDTASSTNNLFTAGSLDLLLNGGPADDITGTISSGAFAPGDTTSGTINLTSVTTITTGVDLDIKLAAVATNAGGSGATDMDKYILVTNLMYGATNLRALVVTAQGENGSDGVAGISLKDVTTFGAFNDLSAPGAFGVDLDIDVQFSTLAENDLQGDQVDLTFSFNLGQTNAGAADL